MATDTHAARFDPRARSCAWLLPLCGLLACDEPDPDGGEMRLGLWGQGSDGETYSLHGTVVLDNEPFAIDDFPGAPTELSFEFFVGNYTVALIDWYVMRGAEGDPYAVQADATLVSPNPLGFTVAEGLVTNVTFEFEIDGDVVPFAAGTVDFGVDFGQDDGVCQPIPNSEDVMISTYLGGATEVAGGGWQSFTAPRDGMLRYLEMGGFADTNGNEGFTVRIREGIGPDGAEIGSVAFPCANGNHASLDTCPPYADVELHEGTVYTLQCDNAVHWTSEDGSLAGATSSDGNDTHRVFAIDALQCT